MSKAQGDRIRALRRERGLTQHQLGSLCDMAASAISAIESGNQDIGPERAARLADALGVHAACLVFPALSLKTRNAI